eukprot:4881680-Pyramimonas_sp.AAC.1
MERAGTIATGSEGANATSSAARRCQAGRSGGHLQASAKKGRRQLAWTLQGDVYGPSTRGRHTCQ